jgi:hypothetical protein
VTGRRRRAVEVVAETLDRIADDWSNAFTVVLRDSRWREQRTSTPGR